MKRSPLETLTLVALFLAPVAILAAPQVTKALEDRGFSLASSGSDSPQTSDPAQTVSAKAAPTETASRISALKAMLSEVSILPKRESITTHEPLLSIYDSPRTCQANGQMDPVCYEAYRDARMQSERSSDIFEDLDACEHRYGENACYERQLRTTFGPGELLYMPIMAGFAMVTDGRNVLARPIYRCPGRNTAGHNCHQTETGIVLPEPIMNRPVTLRQFEEDYTGYMLRQTVRETTYQNGRAFVFIRTTVRPPDTSRSQDTAQR